MVISLSPRPPPKGGSPYGEPSGSYIIELPIILFVELFEIREEEFGSDRYFCPIVEHSVVFVILDNTEYDVVLAIMLGHEDFERSGSVEENLLDEWFRRFLGFRFRDAVSSEGISPLLFCHLLYPLSFLCLLVAAVC